MNRLTTEERLTPVELEAIRERVDKARPYGYGVGVLVFEDIPKLLAEIEEQNDWIEVLEYAKEFNLHTIKSQKTEIERLENILHDAHCEAMRGKRGRVIDIIEEWGEDSE